MSWRPIGLWDVEDPTFSRQAADRWQLDCQSYTTATLYSQKDNLVLISVSVKPRAILWLKRLSKLKKFNDLIGTQTQDPLGCSIEEQPSMLPCSPKVLVKYLFFVVHQSNQFIHFLIIHRYDMFWPHTTICMSYSSLYRSWCSVMPFFSMPGCQPCASHVLLLMVCLLSVSVC
jgi:hypothetical protein